MESNQEEGPRDGIENDEDSVEYEYEGDEDEPPPTDEFTSTEGSFSKDDNLIDWQVVTSTDTDGKDSGQQQLEQHPVIMVSCPRCTLDNLPTALTCVACEVSLVSSSQGDSRTNDLDHALALQLAQQMEKGTDTDLQSLIAAQLHRPQQPARAAAPAPAASGGLDFSSLLGGAVPAPAAASAPGSGKPTGPPVYYPGMALDDAMQHNPHPHNFVSLLIQHDHLMKELRYHQPQMHQKLQGQSLDKAVQIWREEMVKGSIAGALKHAEASRKRNDMNERLAKNPNDPAAKEYFGEIERKRKVDSQYYQMMEQYPESMGRVLMLYVEAKINSHPIQAFVDSGAQMTIMSKKVATMVGLADLIDTRFAGVAAGVGTGKILGKIHIVQLQIGSSYYPCSVSVMDDPAPGATEMPFLLGLDMLKRHLCQLDLRSGVLRFTVGNEEIPFLHEKDLSQTQGGTKGFDAQKANEELEKLMAKEDKKDADGDQEMSS